MTAKTRESGRTAGPGRPTDLTRLMATPDGRQVEVVEYMIELRRKGYTTTRAAVAAGVRREVSHQWEIDAGRAARQLAAYYPPDAGFDDPDGILSPYQRACIRFSHGMLKAHVERVEELKAKLAELAHGGIETEVVTERSFVSDDGRQVVERTVKTSRTLPDRGALEILLKALAPEEFGTKVQVEATVQVRAAAEELSDLVDAYLQGVEAGKDPEGVL